MAEPVLDPLQALSTQSGFIQARVSNNEASKSTDFSQLANLANASPKSELNVDDVPVNIEGLRKLMKFGCWRAVPKLVEKIISSNTVKYPHDLLALKLCRVISHLKTRSYKAAYDEIEVVGDFDDKVNCFENYPHLYKTLKGSMVPFALRIIKAELPYLLKLNSSSSSTSSATPKETANPNPLTTSVPLAPVTTINSNLDPLYELLSLCRKELSFLHAKFRRMKQQSLTASSQGSVSISTIPNTTGTNPEIGSPSSSESMAIALSTSNGNIPAPSNANTISDSLTDLPFASGNSFPLSYVTSNGSNVSLDDIIQSQASISGVSTTDSTEDAIKIWKQRESRVIFSIATRLIQDKDFPLAIQLLNSMITKYPNDALLLSTLGRVYLLLGNVKSAGTIFKQVDSLFPSEGSVITHMNNGYLSLALDQFSTAIDHFQAVIDLTLNKDGKPSNSNVTYPAGSINETIITAANNKAVCFLYTSDLARAVSTLEDIIKADPEKSITDMVIFNLTTLYDLQYDGTTSTEKKKTTVIISKQICS